MNGNGYTLKEMIEKIFEICEKLDRKIEDQDKRIDKLENWRYWLMGIFTLIVIIVRYVWR